MKGFKLSDLGVPVNLGIMIVLFIFGLVYPDLFDFWLEDILWHGENWDIWIFGLLGVDIFLFSGSALESILICKINDLKKARERRIPLKFMVFGAGYITFRIMRMISSYGFIGRYALEKYGLTFLTPLSIIFMIGGIALMVTEYMKSFAGSGMAGHTGSYRFCNKCGNKIANGSVFCDKCGNSLNEDKGSWL